MTEEVREKATFYFQDRLSKFCPADKNRPNEYEITMFIAGYHLAMDEANERIKKLRQALEFYANGKNWECDETYNITKIIDDESIWHYSNVNGDYDHIGGKRARAALKDDDLKST